ncbi:MAG: acyl-CoA/acyl-ACP dehydrogenase [Geodermatophilaceae bacterium]|nr:acyl-CoA/acyl-ACP dehydrogenase [Geodermatophilaceae bacterium]
MREATAAICARYPLDYWSRMEREGTFPEQFRADIVRAGFASIVIPERYGGGGGTLRQQAAAMEEVAAAGGGLNATASVHIPLLCVPALLAHGTEEQRERLLPAIARGDLFVTFGVTEPDAGTDTTRISTRARRTDTGWVVDGRKVWNSGALRGDLVLLLARTSDPGEGRKGDGLTLLLAPLDGQTVQITPIDKIGRRAVASCEVVFTDHPVPADAVVGTVGGGFYHLLAGLNAERLLLAAESIGLGRWALDAAGRYARERVVFDRPIGQNQAVAHPLAKAYLHLLAASEVALRGLDGYDAGVTAGGLGTIANGAKYLGTEAAWACTEAAMQTFGGYSFAAEYHIGRYWTESRLGRLAPVNNEMVLNYVAERALGLPRSY